MKQYRAVITCSEDPCTYCRRPAQEHVPGKAVFGGADLVFDSAAQASEYGWTLNHNVYGSSVHRVRVQSREVTDWQDDTPEAGPGVHISHAQAAALHEFFDLTGEHHGYPDLHALFDLLEAYMTNRPEGS